MKGLIGLPGAMLLAMTSGVWAAEVTEKIEVKATPAAVWAAIGDFCGIKDWHPAIAACEVKMDGADKVRTLTTKDGAKFVEKQVAWDDAGKSYSYTILTSPLPISGYKSTLGVSGSGSTSTITWTGSFALNAPDNGADKVVTSIYQGGLAALKTKLETK
jgi:hypothetical protein